MVLLDIDELVLLDGVKIMDLLCEVFLVVVFVVHDAEDGGDVVKGEELGGDGARAAQVEEA